MLTRWTRTNLQSWLRRLTATGLACCAVGLTTSSSPAQQPTIPVITETQASTFAPPELMPSAKQATFASSSTAFSLAEMEARMADLETRYASLAEEKAKDDAKKGTVVGSDLKMSGAWKDGASIETADKAFKMKWRGRTQLDYIGFTNGSQSYFNGLGGNQGDTTVDFRRLRIGTEGVLYEQFDFAVELDFINSFNTNSASAPFAPSANLKNGFDRQYFGIPAPTDVWVGMHEVPLVGNIRVGNVKPANGLEHANSSRFLDFMERSLNQDAFTGRFNNGFQPGVMFHGWNDEQTMTYQTTITENTYNVFAYDNGGYDIASRVTFTPINDKCAHGRYLLHLGCSVTERANTMGQARIRARGSLRNGISQTWSNVNDTGIFFSDNEVLLIPEIALVYGPWHFQAEYFGQWNQSVRTQLPGFAAPNPGPSLGTAYFQGYYGQVSYFLTGEHREYEGKAGAFGRVVPYENFHFINGKCGPLMTRGAWQVLYRYALLDLNDPRLAAVGAATAGSTAGVGGGTTFDHTFGLNHFLNPNMKLQYNFVIADRSRSAVPSVVPGQPQTGGTSYGFGARLAFDF